MKSIHLHHLYLLFSLIWSFSSVSGAEQVTLKNQHLLGSPYTHKTIRGAFGDGVSLGVPLDDHQDYTQGIVDITKAPYYADPSANNDSTKAIQAAIDFARVNQLATFFPSGKYLISDTIKCPQGFYQNISSNIGSARMFPNVLIGSSVGSKPTLVLAPRAPGFDDVSKPKYVLHFWARSIDNPEEKQPNISFNQGIRGIDIEISAGNHGAIGLRHRGAQGSFIQDVSIIVNDGLKGIEAGIGSGGTMSNISVDGGQIGLDLSQTQPASVLVGAHLINQKEHAIVYSGAQTLTVVGSKIQSSGTGPVIKTQPNSRRPFSGQIAVLDTIVEFSGEAGRVFDVGASAYVKNLYMKRVRTVFGPDEPAFGKLLEGNQSWVVAKELTHRIDPDTYLMYSFTMPVLVNGKEIEKGIVDLEPAIGPPADLLGRHMWSENYPGWDGPDVVNVTEKPYFAKGDGIHDDSHALQRAIDENKKLFFPKGVYRLGTHLVVKKPTALLGVAAHLSVLTLSDKAKRDKSIPSPIVKVINIEGETIIDSISIHVPRELENVFALDIDNSRDIILRDVAFTTRPILYGRKRTPMFSILNVPLVSIRNTGDLRIYGFYQEDYLQHGPSYRHLSISDSPGPIRIYTCNPEHSKGVSEMDILDSSNVTIYGLKTEGNNRALSIERSQDITVAGYGGNASAHPGAYLFYLNDVSNVDLISLTDSPRFFGHKHGNPKIFGEPVAPQHWSMVYDASSRPHVTPKMSRPLLYSIRNRPTKSGIASDIAK